MVLSAILAGAMVFVGGMAGVYAGAWVYGRVRGWR
jgi:hypothetical protein